MSSSLLTSRRGRPLIEFDRVSIGVFHKQDLSSDGLLVFVGRTGGGRKNQRLRPCLIFAAAIGDDAVYNIASLRLIGQLRRNRLVRFNRSDFFAGVRRHHESGQSFDSEREGDVGILAVGSGWTVVGIPSQGV